MAHSCGTVVSHTNSGANKRDLKNKNSQTHHLSHSKFHLSTKPTVFCENQTHTHHSPISHSPLFLQLSATVTIAPKISIFTAVISSLIRFFLLSPLISCLCCVGFRFNATTFHRFDCRFLRVLLGVVKQRLFLALNPSAC